VGILKTELPSGYITGWFFSHSVVLRLVFLVVRSKACEEDGKCLSEHVVMLCLGNDQIARRAEDVGMRYSQVCKI
jgi:hypothetical protein